MTQNPRRALLSAALVMYGEERDERLREAAFRGLIEER